MGDKEFTEVVLSLIGDEGINELENLLRVSKKGEPSRILSDDDIKRLEDDINIVYEGLDFKNEVDKNDPNIILYKAEIGECYLFDPQSGNLTEKAVAQIVKFPDNLDSLEYKIELNLRDGTLSLDIDPKNIIVGSKFLTKAQRDLILEGLNKLKRANILINSALKRYAIDYGLEYVPPSFSYTDPNQVSLMKQLEESK